ncbi:MAG: hypothetical protein ACD_50C00069G0004, partial [uncultured bacterium]
NFVDFCIRKERVTDLSGKVVEKKVLFSPDFGKSIQKATNMEERDGQVWDLTDRLSDRVVNTSGESWHLVASPDIKREGEEHRLIVVHNPGDGSGRVREYFVTIRSSQNALRRLVENISGQNFGEHQEDISSLIISREKNKGEAPVTLRDVFTQFTNALDDKERANRHSFLEELKRDTYLSERELEIRNAEVGKLVKREVKEILKDTPTLSALGIVAQSIPRWAGMVKAETRQISDNQASSPPAPSGRDMISIDQKLFDESLKRDLTLGTTRRLDLTRGSETNYRSDVIAALVPIAHGVIAIGEMINNSSNKDVTHYKEPVSIQNSPQKESTAGKGKKRKMANGDEQSVKQDIELILPVLVALPIFFENITKTYEVFAFDNKHSKANDKVAVENKSAVDKARAVNNDMIKATNSNVAEVNKPSDSRDISTLWQNIILPRKNWGNLINVQDEARDAKLEVKKIFSSDKLSSEDKSLLQESLTRLSVLISAYSDERLRQEFKQSLVVLICQEIQTFCSGELTGSPFLAELSERIEALLDGASSLETRFEMLTGGIKQLLTEEMELNPLFIPEDSLRHIFFILCLLANNNPESNQQQKEVFLTEILERIKFITERHKFQNIYSIERLASGKKTKIGQGAHSFPRSAVIYYWGQGFPLLFSFLFLILSNIL